MTHDLDGPPDLDLAVLAHLRGYPEDLFAAALCRLVKGDEEVVPVVEAAETLGVPPSRALELAAAPGFPHPIWGEGRHQVWRRADIAASQAGDGAPPGAS